MKPNGNYVRIYMLPAYIYIYIYICSSIVVHHDLPKMFVVFRSSSIL
jgi:hypothetical protein